MLTAVSAWAALRADVSLIAAVSASYSLARASGNDVALKRGMYHLKNVVIGRDFGTSLEVVSGVTPQDRIIVNPSDSLAEGAKVEMRNPQKGAT